MIHLMIVTLVPDCLLKAPRAFMVTRSLEELACDIIKTVPDTKDIEEEKFDLSFKMVLIGQTKAEEIHNAIESISEIESVKITELQPDHGSSGGNSGGNTNPSAGSQANARAQADSGIAGNACAKAKTSNNRGQARSSNTASCAPCTTETGCTASTKTACSSGTFRPAGRSTAEKTCQQCRCGRQKKQSNRSSRYATPGRVDEPGRGTGNQPNPPARHWRGTQT
jgi:chemotaxis protein histidine kinase CheA